MPPHCNGMGFPDGHRTQTLSNVQGNMVEGRKLQMKLKALKGTKSESNTGLEARSHSPQGPDNKYSYPDKV